ncbi:MAG: molybdate ABC transporter substrate-binding protein [Planctomycetota bacterium]
MRVLAAASTAGAMDEAARRFEAATGVRVACSYAGSGTLARQIEHGAPADVFVSAHAMWVDHLEERGRLRSRRPLLANRLVVVRQTVLGTDEDSALAGRVAMGDPEHVPAGTYARQALTAMGRWDEVHGRLINTPDVRAALRLVEIGEADAAVVYATDARGATRMRVAAEFPAGAHDPIEYPVAVCAGASEHADAFVAFLRSPEIVTLFEDRGFEAVP